MKPPPGDNGSSSFFGELPSLQKQEHFHSFSFESHFGTDRMYSLRQSQNADNQLGLSSKVVVPELVSYSEPSDEYAVKYQNITALLIEAIKELKADNDDLRSLITELQNK